METGASGNESDSHNEAAVVSLRGVDVVRGDAVVLCVDRLDLRRGVVALVGPNGSGKSTLLHVLGGLLRPSRGEVHVLGAPPPGRRRDVAYVLQHQELPRHLPVTVREFVSLGRAPHRGLVRRLAPADVSAVDRALARMELELLAGRTVGELSGGQRQRALVAQGLAQDAEVLLLDEPTAALDIASTERIRAALDEERSAGRLVVVATHDLAEAAAADTAVLLAGRVVAAGAPRAVLTAPNLRAAYGTRLLDLDGALVMVDDGSHHHGHDHDTPNHPVHDPSAHGGSGISDPGGARGAEDGAQLP